MLKTKKVLVLNKSWMPLRVTSLEKAITLLFSEYKNKEPKAKIIEETNFQAFTWAEWSLLPPGAEGLHSAHAVFRIPEIIQLTRYNKPPSPITTFSRNSLYRRDEGKCGYCGKKLEIKAFTIDHIQAKSCGGNYSWLNCVICCKPCNLSKANKNLSDVNMKLLKEPFVPTEASVIMEIREFNVKSWKNFLKN